MVTNGQGGCRILRLLSERWTLAILGVLANGAARPSELERRLPGASHAVLMRRLKELQGCGAATSERSSSKPPSVHYALTQAGHELLSIAAQAAAWERSIAGQPGKSLRRPKTKTR
jgi:DNA-binding HxlR family transcriptional regulator